MDPRLAIDLLIDRLIADGLSPASALEVIARAARRHGTTPATLAIRITTGQGRLHSTPLTASR